MHCKITVLHWSILTELCKIQLKFVLVQKHEEEKRCCWKELNSTAKKKSQISLWIIQFSKKTFSHCAKSCWKCDQFSWQPLPHVSGATHPFPVLALISWPWLGCRGVGEERVKLTHNDVLFRSEMEMVTLIPGNVFSWQLVFTHLIARESISFGCVYKDTQKSAAERKTWAALNYLWCLWVMKTFFPKAFGRCSPANFELDWTRCPNTVGHHNPVTCGWQLSLPVEPVLLGVEWRNNMCLCQPPSPPPSPLLVAQAYL